jgi:hypothetical protein
VADLAADSEICSLKLNCRKEVLFSQYRKFSFVPQIEFLEDIFFVFFMLLEFNFRKKAFLF